MKLHRVTQGYMRLYTGLHEAIYTGLHGDIYTQLHT